MLPAWRLVADNGSRYVVCDVHLAEALRRCGVPVQVDVTATGALRESKTPEPPSYMIHNHQHPDVLGTEDEDEGPPTKRIKTLPPPG